MAEIHTNESGISLFNEEDYRISVAHEIKLNMPNLTDGERAAALAILEAGAGSMNMSLSEYVAQTFPNGIFGNLNILKSQQQKGEKINGAVDIRGFGENVRALIYAGESADFSTFVHELAHVWQAQLTGQLKSDAEKAFKVENGDWLNSIYTFSDGTNDTCGEAFAYGFEDFLKHKAGEMATEDKKKIFEIFADYMSRTYNGMEENIEISPEIAEVYNAFVSLDDNVLSQAEKAVQEEIKIRGTFDKTNSIFFQANTGDSEEKSNSILEGKPIKSILKNDFNYDGSDLKKFALNYLHNNPQGTAKTQIGDVEISEKGLENSLSHTLYLNKLYSIPAIKDTLEKGTYLGVIRDLDGKRQNNYYFAAPIEIDGEKDALFVRVKHVAGREQAFYIHDVFTLDEIKKAVSYSGELDATQRSLRGAALAKTIIQDYEKYNIIQNNPMKFGKENLQYQIVSESSIRKMASSMEKNRILQNLKAAVLLDEDKKLENLTPESKAARIRMETGWEKGVDGTWKYETDDSISFIKNGSGIQKLLDQDAGSLTKLSDGIPLKNLLEAPELFNIFPFMQDVKVRFYDEVDTYRGSLSSDGIMINTHYLKDVKMESKKKKKMK